MKLHQWCELAGVIGELDGMSMVIYSNGEEVDGKKIKESLQHISTKLKNIFEAERNKLEDVLYAKKDISTPKKHGLKMAKKGEQKNENTTSR